VLCSHGMLSREPRSKDESTSDTSEALSAVATRSGAKVVPFLKSGEQIADSR
jgi:hypothetical protein